MLGLFSALVLSFFSSNVPFSPILWETTQNDIQMLMCLKSLQDYSADDIFSDAGFLGILRVKQNSNERKAFGLFRPLRVDIFRTGLVCRKKI